MNPLVFLSRHREWVALVLALVLSFILMNSSSHPSARKFRFGISRIVSVLTAPVMLIPKTVGVWGDNVELRAELIRLKGEQDKWRDALLENIRLREMLGFEKRPEFHFIAAEVIARDPSPGMSSLLLNKGKADSVRVGLAVVTADGLAGVIHHTSEGSSVAQLPTDPNFAASVRVERSRVDGILRWHSARMLKVDGISKNQDVREGDRIVTSGLGGIIPGGIPAGVVTGVSSSREDIFLKVKVNPFVEFRRLEEVFILLPVGEEPVAGETGEGQ